MSTKKQFFARIGICLISTLSNIWIQDSWSRNYTFESWDSIPKKNGWDPEISEF
jgi:hypothetical protein